MQVFTRPCTYRDLEGMKEKNIIRQRGWWTWLSFLRLENNSETKWYYFWVVCRFCRSTCPFIPTFKFLFFSLLFNVFLRKTRRRRILGNAIHE